MVAARACDLTSVELLNVVGELAKKGREPAWFIAAGPVSFSSLLPLFVSENQKVSERAIGIFAVVVLGSASNVELPLVFSSLMSVYVGIEHGSAGYIAMALSLIGTVAKGPLNKDVLGLLGCVMEPVLAVGDPACSSTIASFIKFLKKVARDDDEETANVALALMTKFATPKQGFLARKGA
jgi:hypothetical protein